MRDVKRLADDKDEKGRSKYVQVLLNAKDNVRCGNYLDHAVSLANLRQAAHPGPLCQVGREEKELGKDQNQAVNQRTADLADCLWRQKLS